MSLNTMLILTWFFSAFIAITLGLQCYQCGQYNDGVGSITPCINETHMKLKECPTRNHIYCIKYVSEGSTVRDCVAECTQKEDWGSKTFCCNENGCNGALPLTTPTFISLTMLFLLTIFIVAMH